MSRLNITLPEDAKFLSSYPVFNIKKLDDGGMRLKGRIVVHANRDADKYQVGADCSASDMAVI